MSRRGLSAQNFGMLPVSKEQLQARTGHRDLVVGEEAEHARAKLGALLRSASVFALNSVPVDAAVGSATAAAEIVVSDGTVGLLRTLLARLAEIPSLAARATTLSRCLDAGVPEGGWDPFLRSIADAVSEAVGAREAQREFDVVLEHLTLQLEEIERWTHWQAGAAQSRRADAAGLELTLQAESARLRREVITSPALGQLKMKMQARLDKITRELLEFRYTEACRQDEHERRASELSKEIAELKGRADDLIKLCAEQEARLMIDALTGCHSRYAYERRLEEEFQRWQRHSQPLTFSVWDIDLFKRVNDSYGHEAGDRLLRAVTQLFAQNKRAEDFLARIGGEEFALLLPMTTLEAATTVADKLRCVVEGAEFRHHGDPVRVTVSAGLTDFRPGDTPTTVYERADRALYQAKQQGRNHCVVG
jgi:diguanylate cyclase